MLGVAESHFHVSKMFQDGEKFELAATREGNGAVHAVEEDILMPQLSNLSLTSSSTISEDSKSDGRPNQALSASDSEADIHDINATIASQTPDLSRRGIEEDEGGMWSDLEKQAWKLLKNSMAYYNSEPVGTVAANDPDDTNMINYDQVFVRDFVPSALAFLMLGEVEVVKNFLGVTLRLQQHDKHVEGYAAGTGLMPASFKVVPNPDGGEDHVLPDFGGHAIARVAPVDSALWWMFLLRSYGRVTGDMSLQHSKEYQEGIRTILDLYLKEGFDSFPTLLVSDGACMVDRRMGIHGHPIEIQTLFYCALRCAEEMLIPLESDSNFEALIAAVRKRKSSLERHVREHYWIDRIALNRIYRFQTEEYSLNAANKFNVFPEQIPQELLDWIPEDGGYFAGNLQPGHMDFRFFSLGNLLANASGLALPTQRNSLMSLYEHRWSDLVARMPLKIAYPALKGVEWRIITGGDPKNTEWSYHNGGTWPTLLWTLTYACLKSGRRDLAERAVEIAERRLAKDKWPEYYDGLNAHFVGKRAKLYQTWSIAGYLTSKLFLRDPSKALSLFFD